MCLNNYHYYLYTDTLLLVKAVMLISFIFLHTKNNKTSAHGIAGNTDKNL